MPLDGYAASRWLAYGATLALVGLAVAPGILRRAALPPELESSIRLRGTRLGLGAACVLLAATCLRLYFQARSFLEPGEPLGRDIVGAVLGAGAWGTGWKLQAIIAGLLVVAWGVAAIRRNGVANRLLVIGLAAATPLAGHGAPGEASWAGFGLHVVHLLATGAWLGTLLVLALAAMPPLLGAPEPSREAGIGRLIRTFSPTALVGAGVTAATGAILAWTLVGSPGALFASEYGRWLLLKLALVGVAVGIGWRNWRVLTPRLGSGAGIPLVRSARLELGIGALILLATAVLVALAAPAL